MRPLGAGLENVHFFLNLSLKGASLEEKNYVDHYHKQSHNITDSYCDLGPCCKPCDQGSMTARLM